MVTKQERKWALWFAVSLLAVTTLPYLLGYARAGSEWRFSGFVFGVEDGNSYVAKMLRGQVGDWLFRTPYTPFSQPGIVAFLPYLLLGKLAAAPGLHDQFAALFQLFRWGAGIAMVLACYDFAAVFLSDVRQRRLAAALMVLGGGLGWLNILGLKVLWGGRLPLEFYSPETFGFLSFFGLPHLALGRALLLWGLVIFLRRSDLRSMLLAGLLWLLLGFMQPLTVATGWAVLGMYLLVLAARAIIQSRRAASRLASDPNPTRPTPWARVVQELKKAVVIGLVSSPLLVYTAYSYFDDPFFKGWGQQNIILSPPAGDYLLAFLPFLPLAALGLWHLWKKQPECAALLSGWLIAFPILAYAPVAIQRRLPDGIWSVLVVLALTGFIQLSKKWRKAAAPWLYLAFAPAFLFVLGSALAAWTPEYPLFIPSGEARAFQFLAEHAPKDSVVLAAFETSNPLPAWAPLRTVTGHGPESIRAGELNPQIKAFYQPETPENQRLALLKETGRSYVFYGPNEKALGPRDPGDSPFLALIYNEDGIEIYQYLP